MKKILVLLVSIMMLGLSVYADTDLAALSDDELLALRDQVTAEIGVRNLENNVIADGFYTVGTDIRAGQYKFTSIADGVFIGVMTDYAAARGGDESAMLIDQQLNIGESLTFTLVDGYTFGVRGSGVIEEQEKASWAP